MAVVLEVNEVGQREHVLILVVRGLLDAGPREGVLVREGLIELTQLLPRSHVPHWMDVHPLDQLPERREPNEVANEPRHRAVHHRLQLVVHQVSGRILYLPLQVLVKPLVPILVQTHLAPRILLVHGRLANVSQVIQRRLLVKVTK